MIKAGQTIAATDFVMQLVAGEALTANDALYLKVSDGKAYKTDADAASTSNFIGFAQQNASLGATVNIVNDNVFTTFSGLTVGATYFLSGTAGAISTTPGTVVVAVGYALSATTIKINRMSRSVNGSFNAGQNGGTQAVTTTFLPRIVRLSAGTGNTLSGSFMNATWCYNTITGATFLYNEGTAGFGDNTPRAYHQTNANYFEFSITAVSETGFTITWAETGTVGADVFVNYEAEGY